MDWSNLYFSGRFKITTSEPSIIVKEGLKTSLEGGCAADLGCGNGRNSIYAASLGYFVDSVDLVYLNFLDTNEQLKEKIAFHKLSVMEFNIAANKYNAIIMTRLLQYLSWNNLSELIPRVSEGLIKDGRLMINYTACGGNFNLNLGINRFAHNINNLTRLLENNSLELIIKKKGADKSVHTNYNLPAETYDLLAIKKII